MVKQFYTPNHIIRKYFPPIAEQCSKTFFKFNFSEMRWQFQFKEFSCVIYIFFLFHFYSFYFIFHSISFYFFFFVLFNFISLYFNLFLFIFSYFFISFYFFLILFAKFERGRRISITTFPSADQQDMAKQRPSAIAQP